MVSLAPMNVWAKNYKRTLFFQYAIRLLKLKAVPNISIRKKLQHCQDIRITHYIQMW